jgi:hypothetical protein
MDAPDSDDQVKERDMHGFVGSVLAVLLLVATTSVWAGSAEEVSGTAPIGGYTFPPAFSVGRPPGAGNNVLGIEITRQELTNPATLVELVIEVSYDGGTTWPPDCVSIPTCVCHDASQDEIMPVDTNWCSFKTRGGVALNMQGEEAITSSAECQWSRSTDNNTRMRARLNVCGASATGTVTLTWRP